MKKLFVMIAAAAGLMTTAASYASVTKALSYKYFDENGVVVGQQIKYCSNRAMHAGNIHTAYRITEQLDCGADVTVRPIVPGTQVTAYTLPGNLSIGIACDSNHAECVPSGMEPYGLDDKGWVWYNLFSD